MFCKFIWYIGVSSSLYLYIVVNSAVTSLISHDFFRTLRDLTSGQRVVTLDVSLRNEIHLPFRAQN